MSQVIIAGDTSGTITLQAPAVSGSTTLTLPASTGTVLTTTSTGICKAWVNYNGVSQTINGSYNVSSVTYSSTGTYIINFTTAMANTNYATVGTSSVYTSNSDYKNIVATGDTGNNYNQYSTTGVGIYVTSQSNNARVNPYILSIAVFA
jgi:hypothetical protein